MMKMKIIIILIILGNLVLKIIQIIQIDQKIVEIFIEKIIFQIILIKIKSALNVNLILIVAKFLKKL